MAAAATRDEVAALNEALALGAVGPLPGGGAHGGLVRVGASEYRVHVRWPSGGGGGGGGRRALSCEPALAALLRGREEALQARLDRAPDVGAFLVELRDLAERAARDAPPGGLPHRAYYGRLMDEMARVGWDRLASVDASLRVLVLRTGDARGREHRLTVELSPEYPREPPRCAADLPSAFQLRWGAADADRTLGAVAAQHAAAVERYQDFWDVMDEMDGRCWVLEPSGPSRAVASRRVAVARHASLHVEVDPARPRAVCECRFLGAEGVVGPLRRLLNERLFQWDASATPLANLERILELSFPPPDTANREEFTVECGICYSYRLGEAVPDRVCDNAKCSRPFHAGCLYEWLRALPSSRQSFGTVFGACPYCSQPVTVALA